MTLTTTEIRKTGLDVVGQMPWGTHICLFYQTKRISLIRSFHTARRDWKARSSACGLLPSH